MTQPVDTVNLTIDGKAVVAPKGNVAPLTGVQLTATTPSIVSVAEAV